MGIRAENDLQLGGGGVGADVTITTAGNVGIGTNTPVARLDVRADVSSTDSILFAVKDKDGNNVFIVFDDAVQIIVPPLTKGGDKGKRRSAFVVSGRGTKDSKADVNFVHINEENSIIGYDAAPDITGTPYLSATLWLCGSATPSGRSSAPRRPGISSWPC